MRTFFIALTFLSALLCACSGNGSNSAAGNDAAANGKTQILETGSTLLYPLMNLWVDDFANAHGNIQITTQGTGSGTGISQAIAGVAQIGASDAYLSNSQMKAASMLNIPLAISAQQINYNVPGLNDAHLKLSGPLLAAIYIGTVQYWDDAQIKAVNRADAAKLPHQEIVPIHRADGSGDTFLFSGYLAGTSAAWKAGPGQGTTISWPSNSRGVGATGNPGMIQTAQNTPYSIAYIGISYLDQTTRAQLGCAALQNKGGAFVLPSKGSIAAAAAAGAKKLPGDGRGSLLLMPGASTYPIVNYEYAIVNAKQDDGVKAAATRAFLAWAVSSNGGQKNEYLDRVHFVPLPPAVAAASKRQIATIR